MAPIQRGVSVVVRPVQDFFSSLGDLGSLRSENEELREQLAEAQVKAERAEAVEETLAELRAESELEPPWFKMEPVVVEMIADQPANYKWAITMSKGSADGIEPDMPVVDASAGGLVGKVVKPITSNSATVLLLTDPQAAASARIVSVQDPGIVTGNGGGEDLSMDLVELDAEVAVGDEVVTAYYKGGIYPPNIPIGTVSAVTGSETSFTPTISVTPVVDFDDLQTLQVLLYTPPVEDEGIKGTPAR